MKAAIDIGTNTVLLLVAKIRNHTLIPIREEQRVPRLGKGVDTEKNINNEAIKRVLRALHDYKLILKTEYPDIISPIVTATSAVRDAANRVEFLQEIKKQTGFDVRLLTGREEAEWTTAGALSVLDYSPDASQLILDIGGGSTEIAFSNRDSKINAYSLDMGCVRFTERFLNGNPPLTTQIDACIKEINDQFQSHRISISGKNTSAVGVAGTLTTLAALIFDIKSYDAKQLNGQIITKTQVAHYIQVFSENKTEDLLKINPVFLEGRSDIFLAGLLILEGFMNIYEFDEIEVSTGGIRHGAILKS